MPELVIENLTVHGADAGRPVLFGVSLDRTTRRVRGAGGRLGFGQDHDRPVRPAAAASALGIAVRVHPAGLRWTSTGASETELNRIRGGRLGMLFQQPKKMFNPNKTIASPSPGTPQTPCRPARQGGRGEGAGPAGRGGLRGSAVGRQAPTRTSFPAAWPSGP